MRIPEEVIQRAQELCDNPKLRWSCVPANQPMCIGFTMDPEVTGLTITPLTEDAMATQSTVVCTAFPGVHWLFVTQTDGCVLYRWREPNSRVRYDLFGCVKYGAINIPRAESTMEYLKQREHHLRILLATGAPLSMIGCAIHGAGLFYALEAIQLITWLRLRYPDDARGLRDKCKQLWILCDNTDELRAELTGSRIETLPDHHIKAAVKGMRAITQRKH